MFDSSGEITPPCGVPAIGWLTTPSSITPAWSHCLSSLSILPVRDALSHQRHQLVVVDAAEVVLDVGVQHVIGALGAQLPQPSPAPAVALRLGRNPYEHGREVRLEDRLQHQLRRHLHHPVPHRRDAQGPLGPICLRNVPARRTTCAPVLACAQHLAQLLQEALGLRTARLRRSSTRSTPAAPLLRRTRFHASCRTSPLQMWSYNAWKRLPGARLAAAQSCLCSCRTLSLGSTAVGVVRSGLAGHSLALTRSISMTTAGTLPSSRVMPHGLRRRGLRLARAVLRSPRTPAAHGSTSPWAYTSAPCPDKGRADGPLVFRTCPCTRAAPHTPPEPPARFGISRQAMLPSP